jgi:hypothetical protein
VKTNGVFEITNDEYVGLLPELAAHGDWWVGEADGAQMTDDFQFTYAIDRALGKPRGAGDWDLDDFMDDLRGLDWLDGGEIDHSAYVLAIVNAPAMGGDDSGRRADWLLLLGELASWWSETIRLDDPDAEAKDFTVFLVDGPGDGRPGKPGRWSAVEARRLDPAEEPASLPGVPAGVGPVVANLRRSAVPEGGDAPALAPAEVEVQEQLIFSLSRPA